jgi:hypothetical protein
MKIEKGTALALSCYPLGKFCERNTGRPVLEFIALFRFDDLPSFRDQLVGQFIVFCDSYCRANGAARIWQTCNKG